MVQTHVSTSSLPETASERRGKSYPLITDQAQDYVTDYHNEIWS